MIIDEQQTAEPSLRDVESELCRLPDVAAVRIVADGAGRPVEVHVLAHTGKHAKQIVRDVQSVALASFGLDIDRRIVSVVQLGPNGDQASAGVAVPASARPRIVAVDSHISGARAAVRVSLRLEHEEATGFAEGSGATSARGRLIATATVDALEQLGAASGVDVEEADTIQVGGASLAVVVLVSVEPPYELRLSGSAIARQQGDDAVVRATLDAVNRRLPHLSPERGSG